MKVLGLDITYTRTGVVLLHAETNGDATSVTLVEAFPMKFPPAAQRLAKAYAQISSEFGAGRRKGIWNCDLAVIEDPIYKVVEDKRGKVIPTVSIKLAELTAIFKVWLEVHNCPYLTVSPTSAKKFITGRGDAEKTAVASEIKRRFGIEFPHDPGYDLSDATALALWGILTKGN